MNNIYITIHTKEHGKQEFTQEGWYNFDFSTAFLHRLDGPAWTYYYEDGTVFAEFYFINDKGYKKEDYWEALKILNNRSNVLKMME